MCIIAYIPQGKQIQEKTIRYMFKGNPDGAGIMWKPKDGAPVEIRKGFMKVDDLIKAYYNIPEQCEKAIHCRIATSGKISVACCHPFPVRVKTSAMGEASDNAQVALMHNGIIDYCTPSRGMASAYSDTMLFASKILYPLQKQLNEAPIQTLIENSTTSRLLIFRQDGETLVFGNWKFEDGIYYSNDSYKPSRYGYGSYGCKNNFGTWKPGRTWNENLLCWVDPPKETVKDNDKKATKAVADDAIVSDETAVIEFDGENTTTTFLAEQNELDYEGYEELPDGYDTSSYWLTVPKDCTKTNTEIENEVLDALADAGFEVEEIIADEIVGGDSPRCVYLSIYGSLPNEVVSIAGYELE